MSGRGGFALLAVLWVIAALTALVGVGIGETRVGSLGSGNRLLLTRGRWAADACLAVAEARWAEHRFADTGTVDLGRETHCSWRADDPTSRINVNTAPVAILEHLADELGVSRQVVESLFVKRPYQDSAEVRAVLIPDPRLLTFLTTDGPGSIDLNGASSAVIGAIPGLGPEAVEELDAHSRLGRPISSLDQLASVLPGERSEVLAHYAELASLISFAPSQELITATGWVGDQGPGGLHSTIEVLVVPLPDRLAVIRRRMW